MMVSDGVWDKVISFIDEEMYTPVEITGCALGRDRFPTFTNEVLKEAIIEAKHFKKIKILDVGCSTRNFQYKGATVYRCDKEPQSHLSNFKIQDLNEVWDYKDHSVKILTAIEVIEHIENPWHFFREAYRILGMDGIIILSTPNILCAKSRRMFYELGYFEWFEPVNIIRHINPISYLELELIAGKTGFKIDKVRYNNQREEIMIMKLRK